MKFTGEFTVTAPRREVYEKLCDARFFASCVSGVEELTEIDPTHYTAVLATKIAFVRFRFGITVELVEQSAPSRVVAQAEGTPIGSAGRLTATSAADLRVEGDDTIVAYEIDLSLAGRLGSIGQPVLRSKAREMEKEFVRNLRAAFHTEETS